MKQIIINTNNSHRIVRVEDDATVETILTSQEVVEWINESPEDIVEAFTEYNGIEVSDAIRDALLSACPSDNDSIAVDIESDEEADGNETGTGAPGHVTVCTSGGLQSTVIDIMDGETTVKAAIYNDRVRGRSGMNDTQLSSCSVLLNGNDVPACALETTTLHDGDTITLNARAASSKGETRARRWKISIPIRPKAVQSSRGDRGYFHVDAKVRRWKESIRPYIQAAATGAPSKLPIRAVALRYFYRLPKATKKSVVAYVRDGGLVPYLAPADLTDNLSKGVIDVCKGIIFEDDSQIWQMTAAEKLYDLEDHMELEFEETPEVMLINGKLGGSLDTANEVRGDGGVA